MRKQRRRNRVGRQCVWPTRNFNLLNVRPVVVLPVPCLRLSMQFVSMTRLFEIDKFSACRNLLFTCTLLHTFRCLWPGSSASAERSFSSLRRLETYWRSNITAQRLNACTVGHVRTYGGIWPEVLVFSTFWESFRAAMSHERNNLAKSEAKCAARKLCFDGWCL